MIYYLRNFEPGRGIELREARNLFDLPYQLPWTRIFNLTRSFLGAFTGSEIGSGTNEPNPVIPGIVVLNFDLKGNPFTTFCGSLKILHVDTKRPLSCNTHGLRPIGVINFRSYGTHVPEGSFFSL
jgi:hypothetical protein